MNEASTLISIVKAAVNGYRTPVPDGCDTELLYKLADGHDIAGLACCGIEGDIPDSFKKARSKAMTRYFVQSAELQVLCAELEKMKMFHMPLKGSVIRDVYPSPEMRTSSDIDILVDRERIEEAKDMMIAQGYDMKGIDAYEKKPLLYVELHLDIDPVQDGLPECLKTGYGGYLRTEGTEYGYTMTNEDLLEYLIWHFSKHVLNGGAGIRNVIDIYLIEKKRSLDREKLEAQLKADGLYRFYTRVLRLCEYWFGDGEGDENTVTFGKFVISSGTFGTQENSVALTMASGKSKLGRMLGRVFPPAKEMRAHYPILFKVPILLPIFYVVRPIQKLFKPSAIKKELSAVKNADEDGVRKTKEMLDDLGLK